MSRRGLGERGPEPRRRSREFRTPAIFPEKNARSVCAWNRVAASRARPATGTGAREAAPHHAAARPPSSFLERPSRDLSGARIARLRERLDAIGDPQPVLEWAMRQLERNPPESAGTVLCHSAPGAGSCFVEDGRLLAILDWEGSRWGDPHEDIGEFCTGCRRVVSPHREGGGAASRVAFLDGYREVSLLGLDEDLVRYWEVVATLGRAVTALEEGHRFVAGGERSIELALSGRRVAEMEIDLLVETDRLAMERAHA